MLGRSAHSVKSSSLSLGAVVVGRIAAAIDDLARTKGALSEAERLLAALRAAFAIAGDAPERDRRRAAGEEE